MVNKVELEVTRLSVVSVSLRAQIVDLEEKVKALAIMHEEEFLGRLDDDTVIHTGEAKALKDSKLEAS